MAEAVPRLQDVGARIAVMDVLSTFARTAVHRRYVKPEVHTGFDIDIRAGRHPVVETMMYYFVTALWKLMGYEKACPDFAFMRHIDFSFV